MQVVERHVSPVVVSRLPKGTPNLTKVIEVDLGQDGGVTFGAMTAFADRHGALYRGCIGSRAHVVLCFTGQEECFAFHCCLDYRNLKLGDVHGVVYPLQTQVEKLQTA